MVLTRSAGVDVYRRALAAGARAVLPLPAVPSGLVDVLVEATAGDAVSTAATRAEGRVVAVAGAKGGAGTTSIALALALLGGALLVDLSGARAEPGGAPGLPR